MVRWPTATRKVAALAGSNVVRVRISKFPDWTNTKLLLFYKTHKSLNLHNLTKIFLLKFNTQSYLKIDHNSNQIDFLVNYTIVDVWYFSLEQKSFDWRDLRVALLIQNLRTPGLLLRITLDQTIFVVLLWLKLSRLRLASFSTPLLDGIRT